MSASTVVRPCKVGVVGPSWIKLGTLYVKLDRLLRTTPGLHLVTQSHFLSKVRPWAQKNKVVLECVSASNRYEANQQLLASSVAELLVFAEDRYLNHLLQVTRTNAPGVPVRHYNLAHADRG